MKNRKLHWLSGNDLRLSGEYGQLLDQTVKNRLYRIDYRQLVDPFRHRDERDGAWRCEFWGKNIRGAILIWHMTHDSRLEQLIRNSVEDLLSTQTDDGCISSYPEDQQLEGWDIWGRKYVMLGLIRYYDLMGRDSRIPGVLARMAGHLRGQLARKGKKLLDFGMHGGLAASSILGAIVQIYRITGDRNFLDWAEEIVASGASLGGNIFEAPLNGIPPKNIGNGKAYEMMSCFQGMISLQEFTNDEKQLAAGMRFFRDVCDHELFITGAAGLKDCWGEYWFDGKSMQTETDPEKSGALGETCITATWLHYGNELLLQTGNAEIPAAMERTVYNAVPGSADFTTGRWIHRNPTPLTSPASKIPSDDQIGRGFKSPFGGNDCCLAQGPESVAMAAVMSVLRDDSDGWYLNFYTPLETSRFTVKGNYPFGGSELTLEFTADSAFPLYLRRSDYLQRVICRGTELELPEDGWITAGSSFRKGEIITLIFDTSLHQEFQDGWTAFTAGPVVLAEDSRLGNVGASLDGDPDFHPDDPAPGFRMVYKNRHGLRLCDYASAGSLLQPDNLLQVWLKP